MTAKRLSDLIIEHGPYSPENPQGELLWRVGRYDEVNALRDELIELRELVDALSFADPCLPGLPNGGCKAHDWTPDEPGQKCPDARAQELLAQWGDA